MPRYLLGIDDTDSRFGHCTTHLGYLIACELLRIGCTLPVYPRLVRLNPNIPFKTRGNAAVCVEFEADDADGAFEVAERLFRLEADVKNGANSCLMMASAESDPTLFRSIYGRSINGMVDYKAVTRAVSKAALRLETLGNGMGVVGASASLGFDAREDHTYELIAYRMPENCGKPRLVDEASVRQMEDETFPHTFNSYDQESGRVLLAPKGPDPVLVGLRGDSPAVLMDAFLGIKLGEEILGRMIFISNQCTGAHVRSQLSLPLKAYSSGWLEGDVSRTDLTEGGHLSIQLLTSEGPVSCMVYEPAGDLKRSAAMLAVRDRVRVSGGVRRSTSKHEAVLNVEKMEVLSVASIELRHNPTCVCGARMKSEGRGKGFGCPECGRRLRRGSKTMSRVERALVPGLYLPSPRAQRHLTKQLVRYGNERTEECELISGWLTPPGDLLRAR